MKNIRVFSSENFQILEVKFSIYLNRRVFVMHHTDKSNLNGSNIFGTTEIYSRHG